MFKPSVSCAILLSAAAAFPAVAQPPSGFKPVRTDDWAPAYQSRAVLPAGQDNYYRSDRFRGFPLQRDYDTYQTYGAPTYMTSINYPMIYGKWTYGMAPGLMVYGLSTTPMTSTPTEPSPAVTPIAMSPRLTAVLTGDPTVRPSNGPATIDITVPNSGAQVFIQDRLLDQDTEVRKFVSPPLVADQRYSYDIRAVWSENGRPVNASRQLIIRSGERQAVVFREGEGTGTTSELRTGPPLR